MIFLSDLELAERELLRKGNPQEEDNKDEWEELKDEWYENIFGGSDD